jgi:hypothetical protein
MALQFVTLLNTNLQTVQSKLQSQEPRAKSQEPRAKSQEPNIIISPTIVIRV